MAARRRAEAFQLAFPRLEPDDAFVEELASAARASRPTAGVRRILQSLRVGLATAGVVGVSVGGAWAAGNLVEREDQAPDRPPATETHPPISPVPQVSAPPPPPPARVPAPTLRPGGPPADRPGKGDGSRGRPDRPGERGQGKGRHVGRPDEHPGKGPRQDGPGRSSDHPQPGDHGKGDPQGPGGGRPADHPR